tara:strand:+ start:64 stop:393 length:330 start_codon:yes stop_codon:yes gene_type:complete
MKKKIYNILVIIIFSLLLYSCQTAKDALQGKKRSKQGDEFLVQKKNPLIMPPDFEKLPQPGKLEEKSLNNESESEEIKNLLNLNQENQKKDTSENSSSNLETSILKKID